MCLAERWNSFSRQTAGVSKSISPCRGCTENIFLPNKMVSGQACHFLHSGVRFDTPATDHKLPLVDKPLGPLFNKVQRYGLVITNLSLLSYHSVEAIICQGGRISKHHTEKSKMFQ